MNINEIKEIIRLIDESSIDEFTYEAEDAKVKLKKSKGFNSGGTVIQVPEQTVQEQAAHVQAKQNSTESNPQVQEQNAQESAGPDYDHEIASPMVGTFYAAPSPESDPFVTVGSKLQPGTVVCIVEAMKLFNEIESEVTGEIVEILVENGELVEYGQPLFRVKSN
jgi:acetyl-CoA carboxylase biotin carboxyl carrier protein